MNRARPVQTAHHKTMNRKVVGMAAEMLEAEARQAFRAFSRSAEHHPEQVQGLRFKVQCLGFRD